MSLKKQKGFTLIELLVVIVILIALSVIIFVALNPLKRTRDARDRRRALDIENILTAVHQDIIDSKGHLPNGLSTSMPETQIGTSTGSCEISSGGCAATPSACVNLSTSLEEYLKSIPEDPNYGSANRTGYTIEVNKYNIVTVRACYVENLTSLSQSR